MLLQEQRHLIVSDQVRPFTCSIYNTRHVLHMYYKLFPGGEVYGHGELVDGYNDPYFDVKGYVLRKFRKIR